MKKYIFLILCCSVFVFSSCSEKYQRISFDSNFLEEELVQYVNEKTMIVDVTDESFPAQLPIYEITEREISREEFLSMLQKLNISENGSSEYFSLDGNKITGSLSSITDTARGYFEMSDNDLEKLAWSTFEKIPFLDGEYEYLGIKSKTTISDSEGTHITRIGVSFRKLLDDIRVVGNDQCYLYFDGSGLVEMNIELYNYEEIGTMTLVALDDAATKIKTPDAFSIDVQNTTQTMAIAETLQVDRVKLLLVNQYTQGCTILQPVYNFIGTAFDGKGIEATFNSTVIAIPDSYTYE